MWSKLKTCSLLSFVEDLMAVVCSTWCVLVVLKDADLLLCFSHCSMISLMISILLLFNLFCFYSGVQALLHLYTLSDYCRYIRERDGSWEESVGADLPFLGGLSCIIAKTSLFPFSYRKFPLFLLYICIKYLVCTLQALEKGLVSYFKTSCQRLLGSKERPNVHIFVFLNSLSSTCM